MITCSGPTKTAGKCLERSVTDRLLITYGNLLRQLFFVAAVVYSGSWDFLYGQCKQLFVSELNNAYFS